MQATFSVQQHCAAIRLRVRFEPHACKSFRNTCQKLRGIRAVPIRIQHGRPHIKRIPAYSNFNRIFRVMPD